MLNSLQLSFRAESFGLSSVPASVAQIAQGLLDAHRGPGGVDTAALGKALQGLGDAVRTAVEARLTPVERGELGRAEAMEAALAAGESGPSPAEQRTTAIAFRRSLDGNRAALTNGTTMSAEVRAARTELQQAGELALLNVDVYNDVSDAALLPRGFTALSDAQAQAKFTGFKARDDQAGFYSRVYFDANTNTHVVVNRGTDDAHAVWGAITRTPDGKTNSALSFGYRARQADIAVRNAQVLDRSTEGRVTFSGHSLGGALASLQGTRTAQPTTVFNPLGLHHGLFREYQLDKGAFHANVRAYVVQGDSVAGANDRLGLQETRRSTILSARELTGSTNDGLRLSGSTNNPHGLMAVIGGLLYRADSAK